MFVVTALELLADMRITIQKAIQGALIGRFGIKGMIRHPRLTGLL